METPRFEHSPIMRLLGVAGAGALALNLVGCTTLDNEKPSTVVSHEFDERHLIGVKPYMYSEDKYYLNLEQCGYDTSDITVGEDGCVEDTIRVTEQTYNTIEDGQSVTWDRVYVDGGLPVTVVE